MSARANSDRLRCGRRAAIALGAIALLASAAGSASASRCTFEVQGEGRVSDIIDARSFRLHDGREVRLAGIEPGLREGASGQGLAKILLNRDVTLRGVDDAPDRYGRQDAFVFLGSSMSSVQEELLDQGEALVSATVADKECALALTAAETAARRAKRGIWADPAVIKNTESPGDILTGIGRFTLVEGKVLSVPAGGDNDLPEFRSKLDTRLRCDYFKAGISGVRGGRHFA